jgi:hypothetical protein
MGCTGSRWQKQKAAAGGYCCGPRKVKMNREKNQVKYAASPGKANNKPKIPRRAN